MGLILILTGKFLHNGRGVSCIPFILLSDTANGYRDVLYNDDVDVFLLVDPSWDEELLAFFADDDEEEAFAFVFTFAALAASINCVGVSFVAFLADSDNGIELEGVGESGIFAFGTGGFAFLSFDAAMDKELAVLLGVGVDDGEDKEGDGDFELEEEEDDAFRFLARGTSGNVFEMAGLLFDRVKENFRDGGAGGFVCA